MKSIYIFLAIITALLQFTINSFAQAPNTWTQKNGIPNGPSPRVEAVCFSIGTKGYIGTGLGSSGYYLNDFWEYDISTNAWTQKANFGGTARGFAVGFSIGAKGYIGTGLGSSGYYLNDFWEYDTTTNAWTQKANFGGTARYAAVGFSIGTKGYIGTGWDGSLKQDFWEYDPTSNDWTQKANFGGTARTYAVGFNIGVQGYIGTGSGSSGYLNDFWEYDPSTNSWTQKATFGGTARICSVGFSIGNQGYIGTGVYGSSYYNDFWEYDPSSNTWTQEANINGTGRISAVGFSIGAKGYIGTGDGSSGSLNDFSEYDPSSNTWTQKANIDGTERYLAVGFSNGTKGYIGTGMDNNNTLLNDFWEYDMTTNAWTQKANFGGTARWVAVGFSIGSKGYIGTGWDGSASKQDFWEYDPSANSWTQKANFGGTARVLAVGFSIGSKGYIGTGDGSSGYLNDFWEYDPSSDTWTQKANFGGTARSNAVGFSIGAKGYIGTGSGSSGYLNDFWEYDPSTNSWTQKANFGGTARYAAVGFSIGTKGYIGTGWDGSLKQDFWEYDSTSNDWTQKANFGGTARSNAVGFSIGTQGYIGTGATTSGIVNDFWEYTTSCTLPPSPTNTTPIANQTICSGYTTTLSASGTGTLGWYSASTGGTWLGGGTNFTTPTLTSNTTYYVQDSTCGASATRTNITVTVNPTLPVSVSIVASANPVCAATPVTFTATPTNGGLVPGYQWQVNSVNAGSNSASFTYTPVNSDQVTVTMTSFATCPANNPATSNTVTMTVNPNLPVSVSIVASANPVCAATPVTFTATPTNGGLVPGYQWQVNGVNAGTNSATFTYTPANNDQVNVIMTSFATCPSINPATSNIITMTVNPILPVSVSIVASANPVCAATPVTFTATPTNGGLVPGYLWQVNGVNAGTNSATFTYTPANNDQVNVIMTSFATCPSINPATSNTITMTVNPILPVSVSIVASANPVCAATPVTFTATPTNGGLVPGYQWQVNGVNAGSNSATFTYTPANNDQVNVIMTSFATCPSINPATSNTISMTVNPTLPVSVSIVASANPVCAATPVTFTATPTNGGLVPGYQWQVNGVNAGTNSPSFTYTPANNDQVNVIMTSFATCPANNPATSNTITMTVNPNLPVSVSIVASSNPVCQGLPVTFTATPTNGGTTPSYQWKVNGVNIGTNSPTFTYTPANNDHVKCSLTSSAPCATGNPASSNTITIGVNPSPSPAIFGPTTICQGTNWATYFTQFGKTNYVWNVSAGGSITDGGTTNSNFVTVSWNSSGAQWVSVNYSNSNGCSALNATVLNVTVNPLPDPAGNISGPTQICIGGSDVVYSVAPINNATGYHWVLPSGAHITNGNNTNSITVHFNNNANSGNITVEGTNSCGSGQLSPPLSVTVDKVPNKPGEIHGLTSVCQGSTENYSIDPVQHATNYSWTVPTGASIISGNGTIGIQVQFSNTAQSGNISVIASDSCGSSAPSYEYISVHPIPDPPVITYNSNNHVLTSSIYNGNQWFLGGVPIPGATNYRYTVVNSGTYYDEVTSQHGCISSPSNSITVTLPDVPDTITGVSEQSTVLNFVIYPNPGTGDFSYTIETNTEDSFSLEVYNLMGLKIFEEKNILVQKRSEGKIDLQSRPDGIYIARLVNNSTILTQKLVIDR
jgi:N-acetylneuraminic acid mutarotase